MGVLTAVTPRGKVRTPTEEAEPAPSKIEPAWKQRLSKFAVCLLLVTVCGYVQSPYWHTCHYQDDLHHLAQAAKLYHGEIGWISYLCANHNEHVIPLWNLWYYCQWRLSGLDVLPWHLVMTGMHAMSALALAGVVYNHTRHPIAATVSGLLWAAAAIGQPENPQVLITASHHGMAFDWIILAMYCVSRVEGTRSGMWLAGMSAAMVAGVMTTGAVLLVTPILPLQYWLFRQHAWKGMLRPWLVSWLVPVVLLAVQQALWVLPAINGVGLSADRPEWMRVASLVGSAHVIALTNTLFWSPDLHPILALGTKYTLAVGLAVIGVLLGRRWDPRLVGLLLIFSSGYLAAVYFARLKLPDHVLLEWGRYIYLPTLVCCLLLGTIADAILQSLTANRHRMASIGLIVFCLLYLGHQRTIAAFAAERLDQQARPCQDLVNGYRHLLKAVSRSAGSQGEPVVLPDMLIEFPVVPHSLKTFASYAFRELPRIHIEDGSQLTKEQLENARRIVQQHPFAGVEPYLLFLEQLVNERQ